MIYEPELSFNRYLREDSSCRYDGCDREASRQVILPEEFSVAHAQYATDEGGDDQLLAVTIFGHALCLGHALFTKIAINSPLLRPKEIWPQVSLMYPGIGGSH